MNMKLKRCVFAGICAVAAVAVALSIWFCYRSWHYLRMDFVHNKWDDPYLQGVPLDEMDFRDITWRGYFPAEALVLISGGCPYVRTVELPLDLNYYAHPEDSEPVLTLGKGTTVYVIPPDKDYFGSDDYYGLRCWPDYQKGWRYGQPFVTGEDGRADYNAPRYYVKTSDLKAVAREFYNVNKEYLQRSAEFPFSHVPSAYAEALVLYVDRVLYRAGVFCSEDICGSRRCWPGY